MFFVALATGSELFIVFPRFGEGQRIIRAAPDMRILCSVILPKAHRANVVFAAYREGQIVAARAFKFHSDLIVQKFWSSMLNDSTTPKRPRDTNQLAKYIVDLTTGDKHAREPEAKERGPYKKRISN